MTQKEKIIESVKTVLCEKNKRYGNSALEPLHVFYKGSATDSIAIRIDDKLSRIKNSDVLRKNDMFDLLGYLFLLDISFRGHLESCSFEEKVDEIINDINMFTAPPELIEIDVDNVFDKKNENTKTLRCLNICYDGIKKNYLIIQSLLIFEMYIIQYFIDNNITDFSDLID